MICPKCSRQFRCSRCGYGPLKEKQPEVSGSLLAALNAASFYIKAGNDRYPVARQVVLLSDAIEIIRAIKEKEENTTHDSKGTAASAMG